MLNSNACSHKRLLFIVIKMRISRGSPKSLNHCSSVQCSHFPVPLRQALNSIKWVDNSRGVFSVIPCDIKDLKVKFPIPPIHQNLDGLCDVEGAVIRYQMDFRCPPSTLSVLLLQSNSSCYLFRWIRSYILPLEIF